MRPALEPSALRVKLAPFAERIAQYPKARPPAWANDGECRPPAWSAGGPALVPECLLPAPLREISTVSVAPDGTVAIGGPDGLAALEHGRWRYYAGRRWLPSNDVRRVQRWDRDTWYEEHGGWRGPGAVGHEDWKRDQRSEPPHGSGPCVDPGGAIGYNRSQGGPGSNSARAASRRLAHRVLLPRNRCEPFQMSCCSK